MMELHYAAAMEAGLAAYPVIQDTPQSKTLRTIFRMLTKR